MLYREIMAVCSQIHTKLINTVCGQNVELLNVKLAVHISLVTTGPVQCRAVSGGYIFLYLAQQSPHTLPPANGPGPAHSRGF